MTETAREARRRFKAQLLETLSVAVANIVPDPDDSERDEAIHRSVVEEISDEMHNRSQKLWARVNEDREAVGGMVPPDDSSRDVN